MIGKETRSLMIYIGRIFFDPQRPEASIINLNEKNDCRAHLLITHLINLFYTAYLYVFTGRTYVLQFKIEISIYNTFIIII